MSIMKKYISFSLWGDKPIYNEGIIKNYYLKEKIYPSWEMIVFFDSSVPNKTINNLTELGVECVDVTSKNLYGMFWRFLVLDRSDCEYAIFRDADSRLSEREKSGVDEWILSNKTIHVIRDHPAHAIPFGNNQPGILGGMWGMKGKTLPIEDMINKFHDSNPTPYGSDQTFLKVIFNIFNNDMFLHDEFSGGNKFKIPREQGRFIGERITENDLPLTNDHLILI